MNSIMIDKRMKDKMQRKIKEHNKILEHQKSEKIKEGETFTFKNFISTTVDRKVAEQFSGSDFIFVMTGLKDIPFLYMPNTKISGDDYVKEALDLDLKSDFSEYTLPRNLEFTINKIVEQPITESDDFDKLSTIKQILKILS